MPLDNFLSCRHAIFLESQLLYQIHRVESSLHDSRVLHCPISQSFDSMLSTFFGFAKLMFKDVNQLWAELTLVVVNGCDAFRLVLWIKL